MPEARQSKNGTTPRLMAPSATVPITIRLGEMERVAHSHDYDLFGLVGFNGEKAVPAEHTTCGSGVSARPLRTRCT